MRSTVAKMGFMNGSSHNRRERGESLCEMKILDYLKEEWILADLQGTDKTLVLRELASVLVTPCQVSSPEVLLRVLLEREKLESTGIGEGIAIPHGRLKKMKEFLPAR